MAVPVPYDNWYHISICLYLYISGINNVVPRVTTKMLYTEIHSKTL